ncbi:MAG: hypothetical protein OK457_06100 [Thaumarchaeota archaeon]|nr:hypothetical protein [Nitrososphaerota archaeon]
MRIKPVKWKEFIERQKALIAILIIQILIYVPVFSAPHSIIYIFTANNWMPFFPKQTPLDLLVSSWTPAGFGAAAFHTPGFFVIYLFQILFADQYVAEILFLFTPYLIASLSMYYVLRKILKDAFWPALIAATLIYSYNWVTLDAIGNLTFLYEYSVAPLAFWLVYRLHARTPGLKPELFLAFVLFVGTLYYSFVGLSILFPAILAGLICGTIALRRGARKFFDYFVRLIISLIFYLIFSLPFTVPQIFGLIERGGANYYSTVGFQIAGTYLSQIGPQNFPSVFNYDLSIFSLLGSPNIIDFSMLASAILLILSFLVMFGTGFKTYVVSLGTVFVLFSILLVLVVSENPVINTIYSRIPILIGIDGVVPYSIVLGYVEAILAAVAICSISIIARSKVGSNVWRSKYVINSAVLALILLLSLPILFSHQNEIITLNSLNQRTASSGSEMYTGTIPYYLVNLTHYFYALRQGTNPFRILWLPQENWLSGMLTTLSLSDQFTAGSLEANPKLHSAMSSAISDLVNGNSVFGSKMTLLGFRYVVVLKTLTQEGAIQMGQGPDSYISGDPFAFVKDLNNQSSLKLEQQDPNYNLYEVQDPLHITPSIFWLSANQSFFPYSGLIPRVIQMSPATSPSSYSIQINSSGPVELVFAENYDPHWIALVSYGGSTLALNNSVSMGWANSFFVLGSGIRTVNLTYTPQSTYNGLLIVWMFFSAITILLIIRSSLIVRIRNVILKNEQRKFS